MNDTKQDRIPGGLQVRKPELDDVKDLFSLDARYCRHYFNEEGHTEGELRKEWVTPGFDLSESARVVYDGEGKMVGVGEVWDLAEPPVHPFLWWMVDPEYEDTDMGRWLVNWGITRSRRALARVEDGIRVSLRTSTSHEVTSAARVLQDLDFELIRHFFRMQVEFQGPPDQPGWPEGISVRAYRPDVDAETVYRVDDEVFEDHFGYVEEPFESGFRRFMHHMTEGDRYDPGLWSLAVEGEEVVGICLGTKWGHSSRDIGHVSVLGVRRPWRRRGIARALLLHCFDEFFRRGYRKVDLGVDASNLTGALDLYYQVGMEVKRQYDTYELELRPGREVSVTELDASID